LRPQASTIAADLSSLALAAEEGLYRREQRELPTIPPVGPALVRPRAVQAPY